MHLLRTRLFVVRRTLRLRAARAPNSRRSCPHGAGSLLLLLAKAELQGLVPA